MSDYERQKVNTAIFLAEERVIPAIQDVLETPSASVLREYTSEEVEYKIWEIYELTIDGNSFISALDSFAAAYEEMGGYGTVTGAEAEISGKQIIVNVDIEGPNQSARAEIVFSNDFFYELQSASLNKVSTFWPSMLKAAQNTLLGMGSVFTVLILISLIISCFNFIPKIQAAFSGRKTERKAAGAAVESKTARIEAREDSEKTGDPELVAVIAAAVAASEGAASTDGFVVRSIKRRKAY